MNQIDKSSDDQTGSRSTISSVQNDIAFANQYRLEWIKTVLASAAALLAFTVSFRPGRETEDAVIAIWLVYAGWAALSVSVVAGLFHLLAWEWFYISYRDYDWKGKGDEGAAYRDRLTNWRRIVAVLQVLGFSIGVPAIAVFAALNLPY